MGWASGDALFAILLVERLHPPLKICASPRLVDEVAEGLPFAFGEVDGDLAPHQPERACLRLLVRGDDREEMLAVPRVIAGLVEHGAEFDELWISADQVAEPPGTEREVRRKLAASGRRKRRGDIA